MLIKILLKYHACPDFLYGDAARILREKPIPSSEPQFIRQVKDSINEAMKQGQE